MSPNKTKSKSSESENELELVKKDKETGNLVVKHRQRENICTIEDTFAETFTLVEISPANSLFFCFRSVSKLVF